MPSYAVRYKDKWAVFTSIADGFISSFMPEEEFVKWCQLKYNEPEQCSVPDCKCPFHRKRFTERNQMTMEEAVDAMMPSYGRRSRILKKTVNELVELGIDKDDAEKLVTAVWQERKEEGQS